jgi:outer membrane protein assembly factor BamE (lipoprotein component of BamABCDE complex)
MRHWHLPLAGCIWLCLLLLASCETLDRRLARNQALLQNLPAEHQSLIQQGQIKVGFTQTEVYLAWGAPARKAFTENTRGSEETWFYTLTQTETFYREERYYDRGHDIWRYIDRPYQGYLEYIFQEAIFSNGALSSFTFYPSYKPYSDQSLR